MRELGILPRSKGALIHVPPLLKALSDEAIPSPSKTFERGQYLDRLLAASETPKKPTRKARKKVVYDYKILRFSRNSGKHTTISFKGPFYRLHLEMLGQTRLSQLIRDIGQTSVLRVRKHSCSRRVRNELIRRTKRALRPKDRLCYSQALRALEYKPRKQISTCSVTVPAATSSGVTRVKLSRTFCKRCKAILGARTFRTLLKTASDCYEQEPFKRRGYRAVYIAGYISNMIEDLAPYL